MKTFTVKQVSLAVVSTLAIVSGAAYDFIDAWLSPETGKVLIEGSGYGHSNTKSFEIANADDVKAMGITDPIEQMKAGILFKTPPDAVQNEQNKVWGELKALKQ